MLSYSSLRSHAKVTLPSVDNGWLNNNNIIKDPPKSITTRRIDKVGSTQLVTDMVEDNGTRICGNILKFPRGVNPAAEYIEPLPFNGIGPASTIRDNSNNPLTLRSDPGYSFRSQFGRGSGGFLSRRIMMYDGAFRPPIYTQEQLLPLSRQPRVRTSCVTHPEMISYSERPSDIDLQKTVKEYVLQPEISPTVKYIIEESNSEHHTNDFIQDKLLSQNVSAGVRPRDITLQENQKCFGMTKIDPTTAYAHTQPCSDKITRDTMLYVMENPGLNYVRSELINNYVVPNAKFINKEGEVILDNSNYILEYPRAVKDVVCAPSNTMGVMSTPEIDAKFYLKDDYLQSTDVVSNPIKNYIHSVDNKDKTSYFIKDDVLNSYNVVNAPRMDDIVARNIIDDNKLDTQKYIHDTLLNSYDVESGHGGSNRISKYLDETSDKSIVKISNGIYAEAESQKTGLCEKDIYVHTNKSGKCKDIRQFQKESHKTTHISDEYSVTSRNTKLPFKLCVNNSVENIGHKPLTSDKYVAINIKNKENVLKDRIKRVHFARDEKLVF